MKTPISYYGGKQAIIGHLMDLVPDHEVYTESFMGGGTLFWAKRSAKNETINDTLDLVVNFYYQLKTNFKNLKPLIDASLVSRVLHSKANFIIKNKQHFEPVQLAWAFWLATNFAYSNKIGGGYKYSNSMSVSIPRTMKSKKSLFTELLVYRIENTTIENCDAIKILQSRNVVKAFHYIDPPYPGADNGHYKGYTWQQYEDLLNQCRQLKGKFLLSNYNSPLLEKYIIDNGWNKKEIVHRIQAPRKSGSQKVEILVWNYDLNPKLF